MGRSGRPARADRSDRQAAGAQFKTAAALTAVAASVVGFAMCGPLRNGEDALTELRRRAAQAAPPTRFAFTYRAHGSGVAACVVPHRAFRGVVDYRTDAMHLISGPADRVVAVMRAGRVVLHSSLFVGSPEGAEWLRVPERMDADLRAAVRRALGSDLAADALAGRLPSDPARTARDLAGAAAAAQRVGSTDIDGAMSDGFRLTLDARRYAAGAGGDDVPPGEAPPEVELWIDAESRLRRVVVQASAPAGRDTDVGLASGWTIDYALGNDTVGTGPGDEVFDTSPGVSDEVRPAPLVGCRVGQ